MNHPMLYWFVPRELVGFAKFLLIAALIIGFLWLWRSIRNSAPEGPARKRRLAWFFSLFVLPVGGLLISNDIMERRQIAENQAYVKAAWAHFKQRCASAHLTYFKPIPPQDGVFIMKPAQKPTIAQLGDQYWMGDPYDLPDSPEDEARGLLYRQKSLPKGSWDERNGRGGFDFVEAPHPEHPGKFLRFTLKPDGEKDGQGFASHKPGSDTVETRLSRYGYTWDDISTPEDRKYWVAGGRLQVVELATGEVVAERVGYLIEKYFGATSSTFNQEPWRGARSFPNVYGDYFEPNQTVCEKPLRGEKQLVTSYREIISKALGTWNELNNEGEGK